VGAVCYSFDVAPLWVIDMGWDKDGRYYTRSRREGGRVMREYVGRGPLAELEAAYDRSQRERRAAERHTQRQTYYGGLQCHILGVIGRCPS